MLKVQQKIIITGAPGAGKSTLLNHLKNLGYQCHDEISRKVIKQSLATGTNVLPWGDVETFSVEVLKQMKIQYNEETTNRPIFCDRAIPDIIAYLHFNGKQVHQKYYDELTTANYFPVAFIAPPWKSIYINDNERMESFPTATRLYEQLRKFYLSANFQLIELPKTTVEHRANYIIHYLKNRR